MRRKTETHLDVCITRCPFCGAFYAEASWYALVLASDMECGDCGKSFNAKENSVDRILVDFELTANGKVSSLRKKTED